MNSNRVPTQFHRDMPAQYMEAVSSYFTSELYNEEKKRNSQHGNRSQKKQKNKKTKKSCEKKEGRTQKSVYRWQWKWSIWKEKKTKQKKESFHISLIFSDKTVQ